MRSSHQPVVIEQTALSKQLDQIGNGFFAMQRQGMSNLGMDIAVGFCRK